MDFDALTSSVFSDLSLSSLILSRKPMNSLLEEALKQRVALPNLSNQSSETEESAIAQENHETCVEIAQRFQVSGPQGGSHYCRDDIPHEEDLQRDDGRRFLDNMEPNLYAEMLVCMGTDPYNSQPCNQMQESTATSSRSHTRGETEREEPLL